MRVLTTISTKIFLHTAASTLNPVSIPKCTAFIHGKQYINSVPGKVTIFTKNIVGTCSTGGVRPGQ